MLRACAWLSLQVASIVAETMDKYMMFGRVLKCHVIPTEEVGRQPVLHCLLLSLWLMRCAFMIVECRCMQSCSRAGIASSVEYPIRR